MKTIPVRHGLSVVAVVLLTSCAAPRNSVTQIGAIDALLAGAYDGQVACGTLTRQGDVGLGTFDRLDGEMIVLDGRIYQVRADGRVYSPPAGVTTPFAAVVKFRPTAARELSGGITFREFQERLDALLPSTNVVCVFRLAGAFRQMKTRSVPAQTKPYVPLVEATRHQSVFELGQCSGTVVGFRMPGFMKGVNVPGCHAHFLTDNRQAGGHVLDFTLDEGTLELAVCSRIDLRLPTDVDVLKEIDSHLGCRRGRHLAARNRDCARGSNGEVLTIIRRAGPVLPSTALSSVDCARDKRQSARQDQILRRTAEGGCPALRQAGRPPLRKTDARRGRLRPVLPSAEDILARVARLLVGARDLSRFGVWAGKTLEFSDLSGVLKLRRRKRRAPSATRSGRTAVFGTGISACRNASWKPCSWLK